MSRRSALATAAADVALSVSTIADHTTLVFDSGIYNQLGTDAAASRSRSAAHTAARSILISSAVRPTSHANA